MEGSGKGKEIDEYDIVVRINKGFPIEKGLESDLGSRTDIHIIVYVQLMIVEVLFIKK